LTISSFLFRTLFRIQCSLKILDSFEIPQIVSEPRHFFPFILHALRLKPSPRTPHPSTKPQKKNESRQDQPLTLNSLKFLNLDCDSHHNPEQQAQDQLENDDDDDFDLDHGILVAGLSLLVALLEGTESSLLSLTHKRFFSMIDCTV